MSLVDDDNGISFLGMFPKKDRELIAQYSNNVIISRIETQQSKISNKDPPAEETKGCCKSRCVCCEKLKNFLSNLYKIVQSNVGLLLLLAAYACCGALIFNYLESEKDGELRKELTDKKISFLVQVDRLYRDLEDYQVDQTTHFSLDHTPTTVPLVSVASSVNSSFEYWLLNQSHKVRTTSAILKEYEDFINQLPAQIIKYHASSVMREWSFFESLFFCGTVVTTIGYGNVTPATREGRVATMIFGCFGIPLCLIFLTRTGKNLTKVIKFLWSFIRRFYFTGSCRRVRKMVPLSRMRMSIFQRLNNYFKENRRSKTWQLDQSLSDDVEKQQQDEPLRRQQSQAAQQQAGISKGDDDDDELIIPYEVDDKFNLPPAIALAVAFVYIFFGALMYTRWEKWSFLDSFYFTFISLSTIGFGDITPDHPKFFLASFIYLLMGLSLIAMVINVIMEAVNDTITKASDSVFNFRKRIKSAVPALTREFKLERRMSV